MSYVLDTSAVSDLMRGDPATVARLERERRSEVWMPQPVVAEISYGLARMRLSRRKRLLEQRFADLLAVMRRIEWTDEVSHHFGDAKAALEHRGERIEDFDLAIAAHGLAYEAIVVTRNQRHLSRVPGARIERWSGE
jgi:tRNA(fMet)-specific endonuclease VapC